LPQDLRRVPRAVCCAIVASKIALKTQVEEAREKLSSILSSLGIDIKRLGLFTDGKLLAREIWKNSCESLILFLATGGTERVVIDALGESLVHTLLVSFELFNSLPAMLEAYSALKQLGRRWISVTYLEMSKLRESKERAISALRPLFAVTDMRFSRIGIIDRPAEWLVYSKAPPATIKSIFGSGVLQIPMDYFIETVSQAEPPTEEIRMLASLASSHISSDDVRKALQVYYGLKKIVEDYQLSGLTINCFEAAKRIRVTPCFAVAKLNSEGVDTGCEGDLPSLLTMMLGRRLTENPAMMGNIIHASGNDLGIAHCTATLSLASEYMLETHMETDLPLGIAAKLPRGRQVTLFKIDLPQNRIVAFTGRISASGMLSQRQCRTQVFLKTDKPVDWLLEDPIGSHIVLSLGNIIDDLRIASGLLGLNFYSP
jgi:L-fucose isomerase-like protein